MAKTDRRVAKSIGAIKEAFVELLGQRDFEEISVIEIADAANVARKTFYLHFADKDDLLGSIIDTHITELKRLSERSGDLEPDEAEQLWFGYIERHFTFFSRMMGEHGTSRFRRAFLSFLLVVTRDKMSEVIENEDDREVEVRFFSYGVLGIMEWWLGSEQPEDAAAIARRTARLYHVNTPPGI